MAITYTVKDENTGLLIKEVDLAKIKEEIKSLEEARDRLQFISTENIPDEKIRCLIQRENDEIQFEKDNCTYKIEELNKELSKWQ